MDSGREFKALDFFFSSYPLWDTSSSLFIHGNGGYSLFFPLLRDPVGGNRERKERRTRSVAGRLLFLSYPSCGKPSGTSSLRGVIAGRCHFLRSVKEWRRKREREREREREKREKGGGRKRRVKRTKKRLVGGDAFNARQRAVVVAIGLASSSTRSLFNVVSAAQDAPDQITDEKRPP